MIEEHMDREITCFLHKKEKATYLCSDLRCHNNPLLCSQCLLEHHLRNLHGTHQNMVQPISEGVERIASVIKSQSKEVEKIYSGTLGHKDNESLLRNLERGQQIYEQLDQRISTLKNQVDLELDLLMKDFHKKILLEKEEFFKSLDIYQRSYSDNFETIRGYSEEILEFQRGLKHYGNSNNLYLKLVHETKKKSLEWFVHKKKVLNNISKALENPHFNNEINKATQSYTAMNLDRLPIWIGDEDPEEKTKELSFWLSKTIKGWIKIPEMKGSDKNTEKYSPYYSYNR